jgi:hypothetical protein
MKVIMIDLDNIPDIPVYRDPNAKGHPNHPNWVCKHAMSPKPTTRLRLVGVTTLCESCWHAFGWGCQITIRATKYVGETNDENSLTKT